jgi:hypothetical protein
MIKFSSDTKEFIARIVADLGKAVLTVGLASNFFEKFSYQFRIGIPIGGLFLLTWGIVLYAMRERTQQ